MIPAGYHVVASRALLYQHCRGYDPELLCTPAEVARPFAVRCPVCEHTVTGPSDVRAVSEWNDHCIARVSAGAFS